MIQDDSISMAEQHANCPNMAGASTGQIIQTMMPQKGCHVYWLML